MPRFLQKSLSFPMAGVSRSRVYRAQTRPYASPWAVNVRGVGPLENRLRGGSRPGLARINDTVFDNITAVIPVTSIKDGVRRRDLVVVADGHFFSLRGETVSAFQARLLWDDGTAVVWDNEDEDAIVFGSTVSDANPIGDSTAFDAVERNGKLFLADDVLKQYDPDTGVVAALAASAGTVPAGCPLVTLYRDRVFLAGADHLWYASRQSDPTDWDFGADFGDSGRAVAGHVEFSGRIGGVIQAMVPINDSALLFASRHEMWMLRGDPTDGTLVQISDGVGVLSPSAWAMAPDGTLVFLSSDGVYVMTAGSTQPPARFSEERIPDALREIDPEGRTITIAYDVRGRGFHLFIAGDTDSNWWIDLENKAMWPVWMAEGHQPVAAARLQGQSGLADVVLGCRDGVLRKFDASAEDDDGEVFPSHVLIGPFRLTSDDISDAMLTEVHGIMAENPGAVDWSVIVGDDAEGVTTTAVDAVKAEFVYGATTTFPGGQWRALRNPTARPRARGAWAIFWLQSRGPWAYEAIGVRIAQLGRFRYGH